MSNYAFVYYGEPNFASPEDGAKYKERWMTWMSSLGDALVNPGVPLGKAKKVSSDGVTDTNEPKRLTGFSIVKADSLEAATELAKKCPHLEHGTVDVAEAME